ncbi:GNAT family N-acetyltransferase [Actinoplanes sp. LDG1-06]|uniref:GNAT family N-acetyltransferase n=1 Tax=Paractinoplanes ovalisporus TaxID=2810368 RepID=A0ABS2A402_9ACTN|nr:GNAT family N-acetyltransferase [Actinoplanes ovalisporus]MBM2613971.1 GNAT family N-acetyltransferase [Actinoplanes ovalisporus]
MTDICVRDYREADRPAVMALAPRLTAGVAPWRDPAAVRLAVLGWVEAAIDHTLLVAVRGDLVVGLVSVAERRHFAGELDAYVGELVVDAGHEGQGVGSLLMRAAEDWGRRRGLGRLVLETGAANRRARAFYDRLGYVEEDVRLSKPLV